jgi:hypothetical protein
VATPVTEKTLIDQLGSDYLHAHQIATRAEQAAERTQCISQECGGVEGEPHLIGGRALTRHAIRRQVRLVFSVCPRWQ